MPRARSCCLLAALWLAACLEREPSYEGSTTEDTSGSPSGSTDTTDSSTTPPGTGTSGTSSGSSGDTETTGATTTDATGTTEGTDTTTTTSTESSGTTSTESSGTTSATTATDTTTTTTTDTTTATTDTATTGTTTTTGTDTTGAEVCDGTDNDGDGLVDEISADNVACNGCTLAQLGTHAYYFCQIAGDWLTARPQCQAFGADLVAIQDQAENDFVLANTGYDAWIGFSDEAQEGTWVWVDGTPVTFTNWGGNAPNDGAGGEDCGQMLDAGEWNDDRCTDSIAGFVCWAPHTL